MSLGRRTLAQALGDLAQQHVALVVAERVVDLLEAVEVDQQQRVERPRALGEPRSARAPAARSAARFGSPVRSSSLACRVRRREAAGDEPEDADPQHQQPEREQRREHPRVARDPGGDRRVREVDLEDGVRLGADAPTRTGT